MKYAIKDENGNITYIEKSDRKKCLTYTELEKVLNETNLNKYKISNGTDSKFLGTNNRSYFWILFKNYAEYPIDIAKIHELFGMGIEIETFKIDNNTSELYIRAYKDFN